MALRNIYVGYASDDRWPDFSPDVRSTKLSARRYSVFSEAPRPGGFTAVTPVLRNTGGSQPRYDLRVPAPVDRSVALGTEADR